MDNKEKKYRRSALSIACYVIALLMLLYIIYMAGSTAAQINQYYAQYEMKAQPMEYFTYIMQSVMEPLINAVIFFMLGYILDEVRKNNHAYYLSDEEIEQAKNARIEARNAKIEERYAKQEAKAAAKAAAAEEAAAAKAEIATIAESSVEEDFVRSLDEELNKESVKKTPRKKSNSGQKKQGENKPNQNNQKKQDSQNSQNGQSRKKADGAKTNSGSKDEKKTD